MEIDKTKKDDISVQELLKYFNFAQIIELINIAQKENAVNVLALLIDYKNSNFADLDPMEEFVLTV